MVEVMIATMILVLALFPIVSMMRGRQKRARFQKIRSFAMSLAQNQVERLRGCSIYYLETDSGSPWYSRADQLGHPHLDGAELQKLVQEDTILNPVAGQDGVPGDEEMKELLERWNKRKELYAIRPHTTSASMDPDLAKKNMMILAVTAYWGPDVDNFKFAATFDTLKTGLESGQYRGSQALTLFSIIGEGLFHPPPLVAGP